MRLVKRDKESGSIATIVDTDTFTADEREQLSDELDELLFGSDSPEGIVPTKREFEAKLAYLVSLRGEDATVDWTLRVLDAVDERAAWSNRQDDITP